MRIRVRFFASFRDQVGDSEIWMDLDEGASLHALASSVSEMYPGLENGLAAVNGRYLDPGTALAEDDEVAFFPPVSGG